MRNAASCLWATCSARLISCRAPTFSRIRTDTADGCGLRFLVHAQIENGPETGRSVIPLTLKRSLHGGKS
jgi:hypothetical protein